MDRSITLHQTIKSLSRRFGVVNMPLPYPICSHHVAIRGGYHCNLNSSYTCGSFPTMPNFKWYVQSSANMWSCSDATFNSFLFKPVLFRLDNVWFVFKYIYVRVSVFDRMKFHFVYEREIMSARHRYRHQVYHWDSRNNNFSPGWVISILSVCTLPFRERLVTVEYNSATECDSHRDCIVLLISGSCPGYICHKSPKIRSCFPFTAWSQIHESTLFISHCAY